MQLVVLNLRFKFKGDKHIENTVETYLDSQIHPFLMRSNYQIRIVVGKGIGSKKLFGGKNLLRVLTENYLRKLDLAWRNGNHFEGQEGVIIVEG